MTKPKELQLPDGDEQGITTSMLNTQFYLPSGATATSAPFFPTQSLAPVAPKAPRHLRLDAEFLAQWQPLMKGAMLTVYLAVASYLGQNECAWPTLAHIEKRTGYAEATIKRALQGLKKLGLIDWTPRFDARDGHQTGNAYRFLVPFYKTNPGPESKMSRGRVCKSASPKTEPNERISLKQSSDAVVFSDSLNVPASASPTTTDENALTEAERALIQIGLGRKVAARLCDRYSPNAIFQQIEWLDARNPQDRVKMLVAAIQGNYDAPTKGKKAEVVVAPSVRGDMPTPAKIQESAKIEQKSVEFEQKAPQTPMAASPEATTAKEIAEQEEDLEPRESSLKRAHRCAALYAEMNQEKRAELLSEARDGVVPDFWDRVGNPDSPLSMGLWDLVEEALA